MNLTFLMGKAKLFIQYCIKNIVWLLLPFLVKLGISFVHFGYKFTYKDHVDNEDVIHILHDIDIVMIAYLAIMIITGLYRTAIDKSNQDFGDKISSGLLKVKLSTSILGVSTVHLLKIFMNAETANPITVAIQLTIHVVLIIGSFYLMKMEKMHHDMDSHSEPKSHH